MTVGLFVNQDGVFCEYMKPIDHPPGWVELCDIDPEQFLLETRIFRRFTWFVKPHNLRTLELFGRR